MATALKVLVWLAMAGVVYYCVALSGVKSDSALMREQVRLLTEQVRVLKLLEARTAQLSARRDDMGRVCRTAYADLVRRLGLDRPGMAGAVMQAFDGLGGGSEGRAR